MKGIHPQNQAALDAIRKRYYFPTLESQFQSFCSQHGLPTAADYITQTMLLSKPNMDHLIKQRISQGLIIDESQARKSLAGNGFQALVILALIFMQKDGEIPPSVIFSLKPRQHPFVKNYATIQVGNDVLKPDLDLLAYAENSNTVAIYSLKTSLRERAGQTHRWRLLLDIAVAPDAASLRKKYQLAHIGNRNFVMGLITTNFYDEITLPQQRGLLTFFDYVYLTKPGHYDSPVLNFSHIATDLRELYGT